MKRSYLFMLAVILSFSIACKKDTKEATETMDTEGTEEVTTENTETTTEKPKAADYDLDDSYKDQEVVVNLEPKSESTAGGKVIFKQKNGLVTMVAVLNGLTEGTHAIHIHESSDCTSADGKSTGGHWNPTAQPHGKFESETGFHKGDIGNFEADADGRGTITVVTREWCIGCADDTKNILDKAIIVHAGEDDFTTQPTGAAGGRVSCGGIIQ